jgi:preprotein translocase subunit SecG
MQVLSNLLFILQIVSAVAMIGLVLIQHGKGADMGASFGSGASGSLFGASGSANFLSRATSVLAVVFFVTSLSLTYIATHKTTSAGGGVMDTVKTDPVPAPTGTAAPATTAPEPATPASKSNEIPK